MDNQIINTTVYEYIRIVRGQKVILDFDLADLYGVKTKALNQSVKRNIERFPQDFAFKLTRLELLNLRSQFVTSSLERYGGARYLPYAFTEQGVAMLSSVLKSPKAIKVNIEIMRIFVQVRRYILINQDLAKQLENLESDIKLKFFEQDKQIAEIFSLIHNMINMNKEDKGKPIGFDIS